jgi:hypothetical protein
MFETQRPYIGNIDQLFDVKTYRFVGARREGVLATDISNGAGMEFTVTADRCMDIYSLKYKGKSLNYLTPSGLAGPCYYEPEDDRWLRSFAAGFLTTCGLTTIGTASIDGGETLGIHGRIANIPADNFNVVRSNANDIPSVSLKGTMNESVLFGNCLTLTREIKCRYGENKLYLTDTVENIGYRTSPHMILYHFNIGYPLLSEYAMLEIPSQKITPRDEFAAQMLSKWNVIDPPQNNARESCFYHNLECDENGVSTVGVTNPKEQIGMRIHFDHKALPYFVQWRMLGKGEYVTGLEPANAPIDGRDKARASSQLPFLEPGEKRIYNFIVEVFDL